MIATVQVLDKEKNNAIRPVGRGGSRGFARTPPFGPKKILYTLL